MFPSQVLRISLALLLVGVAPQAYSMGRSCRRLVHYETRQPEVREIKVQSVQFSPSLLNSRREELLQWMSTQLLKREIVTLQYPHEEVLTAVFPHQTDVDNPPQLFLMKIRELDDGHLWIQEMNTDTPRDNIHAFYQDTSEYLFPKGSTLYDIKAGFFADFDLRVPPKNGAKIRVKHWLSIEDVLNAFYALSAGTVRETHPHASRTDWLRYSFVSQISSRRFLKVIVDYDPRSVRGSSRLTLVSAFPVSEETYNEFLSFPKEFN